MIVFDIETRPLPLERLKEIMPAFDPDSIKAPPKVFDPSTVKTSHLKDPAKIQAKIDAARKAHQDEVIGYQSKLKGGEEAYWNEIASKAALNAETGAVCAVGYCNEKGGYGHHLDCDMPESEIIERFWAKFDTCWGTHPQRPLVGFNSNGFDVPFIIRRSWYLGLPVPDHAKNLAGYIAFPFVDLLDKWRCGQRSQFVKLDVVAKSLGLEGKFDGCTGDQFHQFLDDPARKDDALRYLERDLRTTLEVALRLGV